jgi:hypothetical protein
MKMVIVKNAVISGVILLFHYSLAYILVLSLILITGIPGHIIQLNTITGLFIAFILNPFIVLIIYAIFNKKLS